ncbi:MAG TPA: chlorite dismutase family protein, partial [Elusimicrobiales bacterium]|nr:chlorite dismutase family protein [Elusimicrobiales bacterium]
MENKKNSVYSSFMFLKLQPEFRRLVSNEKIAAKQEFEGMVASSQEKLFLRTYMVAGLRADSDILFWRMSDDLAYLQDICARTFSSGAGKYFNASHSFLGVHNPPADHNPKDLEFGFLPKDYFGRYRYMLLHPVIKSSTWYELPEAERESLMAERAKVIASHSEIHENTFFSYGLDEQEMIVEREARTLEELIAATKELRRLRIKAHTTVNKPV